MFTDTHSHIHFKDFPDREEVLKRANAATVTMQILVGCTPKDSYDALQFVKKHPNFQVWCTLGVHPHNSNEWNDEVRKRFTTLVETEKKIVAIGETGLDYFRNLQSAEIQKKAFKEQLKLALDLDLPAIVHIRDAWDDGFELLQESGNTGVVLHCFTGNREQAEYAWEHGYYTSFSGVLTYPKNEYLREIAKMAPASQILLETDCPYLPPQVYRGRRNEPAYMVETAKVLAWARGVNLEEIVKITTENASCIFKI